MSSAYVNHIATIWDPFERNGTINIDLRSLPWIGPLAMVSGPIGASQFRLVNDLFIDLVLALPPVVVLTVASRLLALSHWKAFLAALLYGFNPWVAAQLSAGHIGILLGYGLLPLVCVTPFRYRGWPFVLRSAGLLAALAAVDVHTTVLAGIILAGALIVTDRPARTLMPELGGLALVTFALCAYWLLPALAAVGQITHRPGTIAQSSGSQAVLAQMADLVHVLSGRSNWWPQFADGLFSYGRLTPLLVATLLFLPAWIVVQALLKPTHAHTEWGRAPRVWPFGVMMVAVGVIPQFFAHMFPGQYLLLGQLPLGAVFRDVTDWTPLYIIGLACLALASQPWKHVLSGAAMATCFVSLLPWSTGDLRSDIRPLTVNDGQVQAIEWLNTMASPDTRTLWLPLEPYQQYPWSAPSLITDPTRFWSEQRLLNPIGDAASDSFPDITASLLNLNAVIARGLPGQELAAVLAHAGVRWVAIRTDVQSDNLTPQQKQTLDRSTNIRLVEQFGSVLVYQVDGETRPDLQVTTGLALFDGSWRTLGKAGLVDPGLKRVYLATGANGSSDAFLKSSNSVMAMGDNLWDPFFAVGPVISPPISAGREIYPFDPGYGYAFDKGQSLSFSSRGIAAVRVLGANTELSMTCEQQNAGGSTELKPIVFEQPELRPRWYAIQCVGIARIDVLGHVFVQGYETLSERDFYSRLDFFSKAMQHGGSAYVIDGPQSLADTVALQAKVPRTIGETTHHENPLLLASGAYSISVACTAPCGGGEIVLWPFPASDWAGKPGLLYSDASKLAEGDPLVIPLNSMERAIADVPYGMYQLGVIGIRSVQIQVIVVERYPEMPVAIQQVSALAPNSSRLVPAGPEVAINEAPGPWLIRTRSGATVSVAPADLLGSSYMADGQTQVSFDQEPQIAWAGDLISSMALLVIGLMAVGAVPRMTDIARIVRRIRLR